MAKIDLNECFPLGDDGKRGPLPKQAEFMKLALDPKGPKFIGYYGGYGSGKSLSLCVINIMWGVLYGGDYVIARLFSPELKRTTYDTFLKILPKDLLIEHRVADAQIIIKSQKGTARFHFVGLEDSSKLDSMNISGASIDEASQVPEEAFLKLQGRLREKTGLRKLLIVGNPKGHDWVFRRFIKKDVLEADKNSFHMIVASSRENTHLPDDYVRSMLSTYSPERVKRDVDGSFDSFEGQIYSEFSRTVHVIQPFKLPQEWTRVIGIDHGYRNPAAWIWGAVDYDDNIYIYREFYEREWLIKEICKGNRKLNRKGVVELMKGEVIEQARIDPSTKARRGTTGSSDFDEYVESLPSNFPLLLANNTKTIGIDRVKGYLKIDPILRKPKLFIFNTCTNLIDEISTYQYQELSPEQEGKRNQSEDARKVNDHAVDALRYLIMSRPEAPKPKDDVYSRIAYNSLAGALHRDLERVKGQGKGNSDPFQDS